MYQHVNTNSCTSLLPKGGNHFAEIQQIENVQDQGRFREMGLSSATLYLLGIALHSKIMRSVP